MNHTYLLIGDGRLATSLLPYLQAEGLTVHQWSRRLKHSGSCNSLSEMAEGADTILLTIRDDALEDFIAEHQSLFEGKRLIHFSGASVVKGAIGWHPLYAFPTTPVLLDMMRTIFFAGEEGAPDFADCFPGLPNPNGKIPPAKKALYHALAVLSGNMSSLIWNEVAKVMQSELHLSPSGILTPYLLANVRNFDQSPADSMTGPVKRGDRETIERNLISLEDHDNLKNLYEAFLKAATHTRSD